jgi:hypothetical protein
LAVVSGHIKNSVKSIIFFGSGKKRGSFEAHKEKGVYGC